MKKPKNYNFVRLMGRNQKIKDYEKVEQMTEEIRKVGGVLHFTLEQHKDGWMAQCDEIPAIMTGGTEKHPTSEEIEIQIRGAIHAGFGLSEKTPSEEVIRNANQPAFQLCVA